MWDKNVDLARSWICRFFKYLAGRIVIAPHPNHQTRFVLCKQELTGTRDQCL